MEAMRSEEVLLRRAAGSRLLAAGAVIGMLLAVGLEQVLEGQMFQGQGAVILPTVAGLMTVVGLLAAPGPARQGVSIQPTKALRQE
jgi:hypothetical protein